MQGAKGTFVKHLALVLGAAALLALCMVNPFLSGEYDPVALPLSMVAQLLGVVGLAFVPIGALWLVMPRYRFGFAVAAVVVGVFLALVLALLAAVAVGRSLAALALAVGAYVAVRLLPVLKRWRAGRFEGPSPVPSYLVVLPLFSLVLQVALVAPVTGWSRDRAIASAREIIGDIEEYRERYGRYPVSLQAQHKDYKTGVVGVEKYTYVPQDETYNLSFEQPRFLLDRFGTREWVVYNPRDKHRMYSHVPWILVPPGETDPRQGWYSSGETGHAHWNYFWFD
jgi:hypothetical protein